MGIADLYISAKRKYREEGFESLVEGALIFSRRFVENGFRIPSYQAAERVDNDERWELMRTRLDPDDRNVLDIGCAEGVLTSKFAEVGMFSIGVDVGYQRILAAKNRSRSQRNLGFLQMEITPENVEKLPTFDVVLLLTVYHHWCRHFEPERAEEMLNVVVSNSGKLFFEPPGRDLDRVRLEDYGGDSIVERYQSYLEAVLDDDVNVDYLGTTDYKGDERKDPMFLLH